MTTYESAEDSYLLQNHVKKCVFGRVLDVGTGSGIQALTAIENPNVKEVVAVDINEEAVEELNNEIKKRRLRKIKAVKSDLFENVHSSFDTIIFNPPYLPQDKDIDDKALYGGKHGWEISEKFFSKVSKYLFHDGKIIFLFSSLTNKKKIDEIISNHLFEFKQLEKSKQPMFEELYVYLIHKSKLLTKLENKGIEDIQYFAHGKRGNIFTGILDRGKLVKTHFAKKNIIKVAIKAKREESKAVERIGNEVKWLKVLNKRGIGVELLFYSPDFMVYEFVEGEFILDFIKGNNKESIKIVLIEILEQCFTLDKLEINKEEMHHPLKHIVIDKNNHPTLLDFERSHKAKNTHNVTQFIEFICRLKKDLGKKGFNINVDVFRELAKEYKETSGKNFDDIIKVIQ